MVRGAGCREPNPRIPRREKNVLDMPSYRSGDYTKWELLVTLRVAVEKVPFPQNSEKFWA